MPKAHIVGKLLLDLKRRKSKTAHSAAITYGLIEVNSVKCTRESIDDDDDNDDGSALLLETNEPVDIISV